MSTAGTYVLNGFYHISNTPTVVGGYNEDATISGALAGEVHGNVGQPVLSRGLIVLKRQSTGTNFETNFDGVVCAPTTGAMVHFFAHNRLTLGAVGSALNVLAFRILSPTGDNWASESYVDIEWL